jgi:hypothetical protein
MAKKRVQIGQVFQAVGSVRASNWRVVATLDLHGIPHARVVSVEDDGEMKTLSCLILVDPARYRLIQAAPVA